MNKETRDILKMRAVVMAREPEEKKTDSPVVQLITFTLAGESYGIASRYVREVYPLKDFTSLPGVPPFILGIINVRGQIITVVDLKKLFNLLEVGLSEQNKVIIIHNEQMEFGILADVVHGIKQIEVETIRTVPSTLKGIGQEYLMGVTKDRLIVLSAGKLLMDKDIIVNDIIT